MRSPCGKSTRAINMPFGTRDWVPLVEINVSSFVKVIGNLEAIKRPLSKGLEASRGRAYEKTDKGRMVDWYILLTKCINPTRCSWCSSLLVGAHHDPHTSWSARTSNPHRKLASISARSCFLSPVEPGTLVAPGGRRQTFMPAIRINLLDEALCCITERSVRFMINVVSRLGKQFQAL